MYTPDEIEAQRQFEIKRRTEHKKKLRLQKRLIGAGSFFVALLPTWIFMLLYHIAGPGTFMEKAAMIGMGLFFAGGFQIFMLCCWIYLLIQMADWR